MLTIDPKAEAILNERFGRDREIALATIDGSRPTVRTIDAYYEQGSFYAVTYAKSNKMIQIGQHPQVAVCGEWFTAQGVGENLGYILADKNKEIHQKLKTAFACWYGNGHINEADENTVILRIRLTEGILFSHGERHALVFSA